VKETKIKRITFPTATTQIEDAFNDNIDVIVELCDGRSVCVVVATPQNLTWQMEKENMDFLPFGEPMIIVSKIDADIIERALHEYEKDAELFERLFLR
jgi:hypothetical protein